ncbi:MAG: mannose-6-phosphate isomerase, class I [Thiohalocapsa sp.]
MAESGAAGDSVAETARIIATAAVALKRRPRPLALACAVQHYDWGDPAYIPALIGESNTCRRPFAELWIGAHPDLSSVAQIDGKSAPLSELLSAAPDTLLGPRVSAAFRGRLPFLFKVLAAQQPLSVQVHPNLDQARAGFDRENHDGIPVDDPRRNYRDFNHKPELLVALTDFYALSGFRPLGEIARTLAVTPELAALANDIETNTDKPRDGLASLYQRLMRMPQHAVNTLLDPLISRLQTQSQKIPYNCDDRRYWLLRADQVFSLPGRRDRGLFSILLLNLMYLRPGQAIYLPAGVLHSYLQGAGLELMANSNNVLRGGLTQKHIDVDELLNVISFDAGPAELIKPHGTGKGRLRYRVPTTEFELQSLSLRAGTRQRLKDSAIQLGLVLNGEMEIRGNNEMLRRQAGQSFLIPAGLESTFSAMKETNICLAGVPAE